MVLSWRVLGILTACLLAASSLLGLQPQARTLASGVFSPAQATRGQAVYTARCASCHAPTLAGRTGPALAGDDFNANWAGQPLLDLANKIRRTMPRDTSPRLSAQETADVLAFMLQTGKFPAGSADLSKIGRAHV